MGKVIHFNASVYPVGHSTLCGEGRKSGIVSGWWTCLTACLLASGMKHMQ
jgi:hypothetical protein